MTPVHWFALASFAALSLFILGLAALVGDALIDRMTRNHVR